MFPNCPTLPLTKNINLIGLLNKTFLRSKIGHTVQYLGEFEAEFKKALVRESGAQGVLFDEKNRGPKIS
jgi:hypothetical protein